jgi:hypothetical protein
VIVHPLAEHGKDPDEDRVPDRHGGVLPAPPRCETAIQGARYVW